MTFQIGRGTRNGCRSAVAKGQTDTSDVVHLLDGLQVRTSDGQARGERLQRVRDVQGRISEWWMCGGRAGRECREPMGREVRSPGM